MDNSTWTLLTAPKMGAIAIIQITGDVTTCLQQLTGRTSWTNSSLQLVQIPDIDEVIAVKISDDLAHIMPHGSIHILNKIATTLETLGIQKVNAPRFPEAENAIERAMLHALSTAKSPLAVELLLQQPALLRNASPTDADLARSAVLNHLIHPPKVVLLGEPNTGKSTLMNALTKQDTSIVHELPGATRDAVGARINCGGLVIDMYDLPGVRESQDHIEQKAIHLSKTLIAESVLTVLIADAEHDWLQVSTPHITVATKSDIKTRADCNIQVSAHTGIGMEELTLALRDEIVPQKFLTHDGPWFFSGYSPTEE